MNFTLAKYNTIEKAQTNTKWGQNFYADASRRWEEIGL